MKKFLAILLIAIVACETVEELHLEDVLDWLRNSGILEAVKSQIINYGKKIAVDFCARYISRSICQTAVDILAGMI